MQLFSGPLSLFSRKVEIALHEKGIVFERVEVPFTQTRGYSPKHPAVVSGNPKQQVPVLADGDLVLYDSTVIAEYLEDAYPEPRLFPLDVKLRARCRLLEVFADEILLAPVRALMHLTEPFEADPQRWERLEAATAPALDLIRVHMQKLDSELGNGDYLCGAFSIADIANFMTVHFAVRLGSPDPGACPALSSWYRRLSERPAFERVAGEIAEADARLSYPFRERIGLLTVC